MNALSEEMFHCLLSEGYTFFLRNEKLEVRLDDCSPGFNIINKWNTEGHRYGELRLSKDKNLDDHYLLEMYLSRYSKPNPKNLKSFESEYLPKIAKAFLTTSGVGIENTNKK